ncbi:MAG: glycosyltransferase family 4 protein [Bacteroidota bacterium]|nr:glycosyltransferase family 4 protein [Bacteroidota bacterium]
MRTKKINVFLGGFINLTNAQNLNCYALAKHLDKKIFNVYSLELYSGNLENQKGTINGLKIFNCFYPAKISIYLGFLWGIWNCDVAYLPKSELWRWNSFWLNILNKKSFSTMEGIIDEIALKNAIDIMGSEKNYLVSRRKFNKQFSITNYMKNYNYKNRGIQTEDKILYLGVNSEDFNIDATRTSLHNVLMIGNDLVRKGIYDYLELASKFPDILFFVAGSGNGKIDLDTEIKKQKLKNVIYKGLIKTPELINLLKKSDLHILPSKSEGFPKVTLETAAAGIPSLVYGDYGADEWITHNHNGWVVNSLPEMIKIIRNLIDHPKLLLSNSKNAEILAKRFDWSNIITEWEEEIINLYHN